MLKFTTVFRGLAALSAFVMGVSIFGGQMLETNKIMVDQTLGTKSTIIVTDQGDDSTLFTTYVPDEDLMTDGKIDPVKWDKAHKDTAVTLQEEGTVLLKNDNCLPLTQEKPKITIFGTRGINLAKQWADEFDVNPTVSAAYGTKATTTSPSYANNKAPYKPFDNKEVYPSALEAKDANYKASFANYNDAAVVVLGRQNA